MIAEEPSPFKNTRNIDAKEAAPAYSSGSITVRFPAFTDPQFCANCAAKGDIYQVHGGPQFCHTLNLSCSKCKGVGVHHSAWCEYNQNRRACSFCAKQNRPDQYHMPQECPYRRMCPWCEKHGFKDQDHGYDSCPFQGPRCSECNVNLRFDHRNWCSKSEQKAGSTKRKANDPGAETRDKRPKHDRRPLPTDSPAMAAAWEAACGQMFQREYIRRGLEIPDVAWEAFCENAVEEYDNPRWN